MDKNQYVLLGMTVVSILFMTSAPALAADVLEIDLVKGPVVVRTNELNQTVVHYEIEWRVVKQEGDGWVPVENDKLTNPTFSLIAKVPGRRDVAVGPLPGLAHKDSLVFPQGCPDGVQMELVCDFDYSGSAVSTKGLKHLLSLNVYTREIKETHVIKLSRVVGWLFLRTGLDGIDNVESASGFARFFVPAMQADDHATVGGVISFWIIRFCIWGGMLLTFFNAYKTWFYRIFPLRNALCAFWPYWFVPQLLFSKGMDPNFDGDGDSFVERWASLNREMHARLKAGLIPQENEKPKPESPETEKGKAAGIVKTKQEFEDLCLRVWQEWGHEKLDDLSRYYSGQMNSRPALLKLFDKIFFWHNGRTNHLPTHAIFDAGLKNLKNNAMNWFAASEEVDRAIENHASNEINRIKRDGGLEWIWYLAALAPLAGLFGTVTGISEAFRKLGQASSGGQIDPNEVVGMLAPHINEALWTTVFGLVLGMLLLVLYSYFNHKISWIYSKWEEIFVRISEEL